MKKAILIVLSFITAIIFQTPAFPAVETGLDLNKDMMGLRIKKNSSNPIKSGLMNLQVIKRENNYYLGGSYDVDKKWWLPIKKRDSLDDRAIPAVIGNYDKLMKVLEDMEREQVQTKSYGFGSITLIGKETVNGVKDCLRLVVKSGIGEIELWIHPTQELDYSDFRAPIFVKVIANAELPIVGKYMFELDLEKLNHRQL
ncbi:MAG: hypothetical protein CME68_00375 [Halobacteriovoraceae bacterium]|nr:hypothetical protein [Halobacteriovoraceae bacterium]